MKRILAMFVILSTVVLLAQEKQTHEHAIEVKYKDSQDNVVKTQIARDLYLKCIETIPFEPKNYWREGYALEGTPADCKKTYIISAGKLSPIKMHDNIETYGELEVLEFLEEAKEDKKMLFVDARKEKWYKELTIPSAINIPFNYFTERTKWDKEREEALYTLGVKKKQGGYDFKEAKTILLFCNGIWCRQSPQMIEVLLEIGYPAEKMKWYRGGLQNWTSVGLTVYRPDKLIENIEMKKQEPETKWWFDVLLEKFEKTWASIVKS